MKKLIPFILVVVLFSCQDKEKKSDSEKDSTSDIHQGTVKQLTNI